MKSYSLTQLADHELLCGLKRTVTHDCATTAELLAHIAEVDDRKLYLPAAYPSMYAYCIGELGMSEDAAAKRIQAARAARRFPAIFAAVADGRLHLSAVVLLASHLSPEGASDLLTAAAHKTKAEIERLLAARFPRPDVPTGLRHILPGVANSQHAPGHVAAHVSPGKLAPVSAERYVLQVTIDHDTHDLLRYAQALLGHAVPSGDVAQVLRRALESLVHGLEQRRFAPSGRSVAGSRRRKAGTRYVPAAVRRAVWQRDGGQCTFASESGHRCEARTRLEFDHLDPFARGGEATVEGTRLRCRAHNQYTAECTFGAGFMRGKRREARARTAPARARREKAGAAACLQRDGARPGAHAQLATPRPRTETSTRASASGAPDAGQDVIPWLRALGCRVDEARRAATACADMADAPFEARLRAAISTLAPPGTTRFAPPSLDIP